MRPYVQIFVATLYTGLLAVSAHAQDDLGCFDELTDCFRLESDFRSECFQRGAQSSSCRDTDQGRLAAKRGAISGSTNQANNDLAATPQASIIDHDCVDNFDSFWLGNLVNGPMSSETINNLHEMLDGCNRSTSPDLMRP